MFDVGGFFGPEGLQANQNCPRLEHMMETMSFGKPLAAKEENLETSNDRSCARGRSISFPIDKGP